MNRFFNIFLLILVLALGQSHSIQQIAIESKIRSRSRSPASIKKGIPPRLSCAQTFTRLLNDKAPQLKRRVANRSKDVRDSVKEALDYTPAWDQLKSLPAHGKLMWFKRWSNYLGNSHRGHQRFARLFNKMIEKGVTSPEEAFEMIKTLKREKKIPFIKVRIGGKIQPDLVIDELKTLDGPMKLFLDNKNSAGRDASSILSSLSKSLLSKSQPQLRARFRKGLEQADLNPDDLTILENTLAGIRLKRNPSESMDKIISYSHYIRSLFPDRRAQAISELPTLLNSTDPRLLGRHARKFQRIERKNLKPFKARKWRQFRNKKLKELKKTRPKMNQEQRLNIANRHADREARKLSHEYENQVFSCKSKMSNRYNRGSGAAFGNVLLGINLAANLASYGALKGEEPWGAKDAKRLSFDVVMSVILTKLTANIYSNPRMTPVDQWVTGNITFAGLTAPNYTDVLVDDGIYGLVVGGSDQEAKERLDEILSQPGAREELIALGEYLEETGIIEKFRTQLEQFDYYDPPQEVVDFMQERRKLTGEELSDAEVMRDAYLEAMAMQAYDEKSGGAIQTGSESMDIYLYNRLYSAYSVAETQVISKFMLSSLCLNSGAHWAKRYGLAAMIYTLNTAIHTPIYYGLRKYFTGGI